MFSVGDIVRCIDKRVWSLGFGSSYIRGIDTCNRTRKRLYIVEVVRDYPDGSQSLWVRSRNGDTLRGPYCHLRFELEARSDKYQYDPNQTGDTDDDI